VGLKTAQGYGLAALEDGKPIIPTAVFFDFDEDKMLFGQKAVHQYIEGAEGRLLRAIKSILGSNLMDEKTFIQDRQLSFREIIGYILAHLKSEAEKSSGSKLQKVVLGRPVHFNDNDPKKDQRAQDILREVALEQGFQQVEFQYEPIAAALAYEQQSVRKETLALIADIGGGTSDFSIIRLGTQSQDRKQDILANAGVHIGGTDFDRKISMKEVMPYFGKGSTVKTMTGGKIGLPVSYFNDMATWHRINSLYSDDKRDTVERFLRSTNHPQQLQRFHTLMDFELGHLLNTRVEEQKQILSSQSSSILDLGFVEKGLNLELQQTKSNQAIEEELEKLGRVTADILKQAGIKKTEIEAIFFTGGSTKIPILKKKIFDVIPQAEVIEGDAFGSVGYGLVIDAEQKFS